MVEIILVFWEAILEMVVDIMGLDIVPVNTNFTIITTWFSLSRGQIVKISIKNSILSNFAL